MAFETLGVRVKTAAVLVAAVLALLLIGANVQGGGSLFAWVIAILAFVTAYEFANVCSRSEGSLDTVKFCGYWLLISLPVLLYAVYALGDCGCVGASNVSLLAGFCAAAYVFAAGNQSLDRATAMMRDLPMGMFFVAGGSMALLSFAHLSGAAWIIAWLILVAAATDSGAYFVGSKIGGPKLAPLISPNKTISGALGGLALAIVIGGLTGGWISGFGVCGWLAAAVCSIAAQLGDLAKSYVKRLHQVKDMSSILPGHGGILDRIDGILAAALMLRALGG